MKRISAAENSIIEIGAESWRLIQRDEELNEHLVLEAVLGQPLRYTANFAVTHHLPAGGVLPVDYIRQVVVGWSFEDEAWHLGFLLVPDLADARRSRWCEVAWWPDPDLDVFAEFAEKAGRRLAQVLVKPLNFIAPRPDRKSQQAPLPELPLEVGLWQLSRLDDNVLALTRARKWMFPQLGRLVWYLFWAAIYVLLSVLTLTSDLALPNAGTLLPSPELLPYLGLGTAAVLVGLSLYLLNQILTSPDRIVIDGQAHRVVGMRGAAERWERTSNNLCDVYVTQVIQAKRDKRIIHHGELNLRQTNGDFYRLFQQPDKEECDWPVDGQSAESQNAQSESLKESLFPLTSSDSPNGLQAIGLHIARTLGDLPCWYDQRIQ